MQDLATPIFSWGNSEPYLSGCIRKLASVFESTATSLDGLVSRKRGEGMDEEEEEEGEGGGEDDRLLLFSCSSVS